MDTRQKSALFGVVVTKDVTRLNSWSDPQANRFTPRTQRIVWVILIVQSLASLHAQAFIAHFFMGFPYIHKGEFENAIQEFKQSTVIGDAGSLSGLGYAYAMSGNKAETQNVLLRLKHP
jgi:hypothetical protein